MTSTDEAVTSAGRANTCQTVVKTPKHELYLYFITVFPTVYEILTQRCN